jgi:hypothetical protein
MRDLDYSGIRISELRYVLCFCIGQWTWIIDAVVSLKIFSLDLHYNM